MTEPTATAHRVAPVTGASRRIGREAARALAGRGFSLFLAAKGTVVELAKADRHLILPGAACPASRGR